jgi:pSer/pThr/pTyr-binding forkhead associated (FHA) protein
MLGKLIPCGGGVPVPLGKPTQVIGRSRDCDIVIACASVSGRHCEMQLREGAWWVRDLGSKNGTAVNGIKGAEQRVGPDDVLSVGRQRFVLSYQAAASPLRLPAANDDVDALALQFLSEADEPAAAPPPLRAPERPVASVPAPARANLGALVPCGGGDTIGLPRPELIVGRNPACDVCLQFTSISSRHCKLSLQEGYWFVQDLHSTNGTWVDGTRCEKKCLLPSSVLGLARHRYTMRYTPTGAGPPPEEEMANVFSQSLLEKAGLAKLIKGGPPDEDESQSRRYKLDLDDN